MGARLKSTSVCRDQPFVVSLASKNQSTCEIERVEVILEEECYWTTKSKGGYGKKTLVEERSIGLLHGLKLSGIRRTENVTDESIAKKMYRDLKSRHSELTLTVPTSAYESYTGLAVKISHYLKVTLVLMTKSGFTHPSIRIPILVESDPAKTITRDSSLGMEFSDHVSEKPRVRFPPALLSPDQVALGSHAAMLDNAEGPSLPIPPHSNDNVSCLDLIEEISASLNAYNFLAAKMTDLDWAIFLASLSPQEFGSIIAHVNNEFYQPRVGALLAQNFGGDFTCGHCAKAIENTSKVFRSEMVEGLLGFCSDLAENNLLIRDQLDEFEQIVVALHALNDEEDTPEPDTKSPTSPSKTYEAPPSPTRPSKGSNEVKSSRKSSKNVGADSITPTKEDICIGDDEHPGTIELVAAVRRIVVAGTFNEFCPPVFRRIKRKFKDRRFLMRPFEDLKYYWRDPSNRELIEYVSTTFDNEKLKFEEATKKKVEEDDIWNEPALEKQKSWKSATNQPQSGWDLAVTIHSYVSGITGYNTADEDDWYDGPSESDVCFDRTKHPGNVALIKAVRTSLKEFAETPWSPRVYKAIKSNLSGRRFFIKNSDGQWKEATQQERRKKLSIIFEREKKGAPVKKRRSSRGPMQKVRSDPAIQVNSPSGRRRSSSSGPLRRRGGLGALKEDLGSSMRSTGRRRSSSKGPLERSGKGPLERSSKGSLERQGTPAPPVATVEVNGSSSPKPRKRRSSVKDLRNQNRAPREPRSPIPPKKSLSMENPRDFDICYGLDRHPGTVSFQAAVMRRLEEAGDKEWNPTVYKAIRAQLVGRRFFIRPNKKQPWREATAQERVECTRKQFVSNQRGRKR